MAIAIFPMCSDNLRTVAEVTEQIVPSSLELTLNWQLGTIKNIPKIALIQTLEFKPKLLRL